MTVRWLPEMTGGFVTLAHAVAGSRLVFACSAKFVSTTGHEILTCEAPNVRWLVSATEACGSRHQRVVPGRRVSIIAAHGGDVCDRAGCLRRDRDGDNNRRTARERAEVPREHVSIGREGSLGRGPAFKHNRWQSRLLNTTFGAANGPLFRIESV